MSKEKLTTYIWFFDEYLYMDELLIYEFWSKSWMYIRKDEILCLRKNTPLFCGHSISKNDYVSISL